MTEAARIERNRTMLQQVNAVMRGHLAIVIAQMEQTYGFRPRIQCAWRSIEDEGAAHASGHSDVTFGYHNLTTADGRPDALAADVLDDDHPLAASRRYVLTLARLARAQHLDTGIVWGLPKPPAMTRVMLNQAIASGVLWEGPIGWDACHVEWSGITIEQAQAGMRPAEGPTTVNV